jgi:hypothetical protein
MITHEQRERERDKDLYCTVEIPSATFARDVNASGSGGSTSFCPADHMHRASHPHPVHNPHHNDNHILLWCLLGSCSALFFLILLLIRVIPRNLSASKHYNFKFIITLFQLLPDQQFIIGKYSFAS